MTVQTADIPVEQLPDDPRIDQSFGEGFLTASQELGRYADTELEVAAILDRLSIPPGSEVLDIPCGIGRHAAILHGAGMSVTGLEGSIDQIQLARQLHPGPAYVEGNMFRPPESFRSRFSLVLNLYSSFGYAHSVEKDIEMLRFLHSCLSVNGCLVMQLSDLERACFNLSGKTFPFRRDDYEEIEFDWEMQTLMVRYKVNGQYIGHVNMRVYSDSQLRQMLDLAGFKRVEMFGTFEGAPKRASDRLIIYARQ
jgi:SAM-dependent methyltransferase